MSEELRNLIERFKRASDSRLFAPLADAYRKNGEFDKAIELLERGLERYPRYASARVILGKCYYDKGATERAKAEFLHVIEFDGENMVALKFLGDILLAEDKRNEAADCYRRLLAVDPTNEEVARTLKEMEASFAMKEIDLSNAETARDERPRDLATMTLAGIYAAQGYYGKALRIYREVLEREPGNQEALEMTAKLESIMNSTEAERDRAFQDKVLTISLDDVSEGLISNTAGHGGDLPGARTGEEPARGDDRVASDAGGAVLAEDAADRAAAGELPAEPPAAAPEPGAERREAPEGASENILADRDMDNFREWLKRLKDT